VQLKHLTWLGKATFAANANIDRESALVLTEKVMLKMLAAASRVYDVSEQEELSRKCILHALRDKHCFLYDSLLNAKCVQHLQGTPSYRLLEIFTTGTLPDFRQYISTSAGQDFLGELAIAESERLKSQNNKVDKNLIMNFLERKIRQLTFIELAGQCIRKNRYNNGEPNSSESSLNLDQLKEDLDLKDDIAVEEFIIDAIRTNMVKAKLSQSARKVIIHHAVPRQFTRSHWEELAIRLNNWREQITRVNKGFDDIINKTAPEVFRQSIA
jgi:translation initiation factor 3 subunit M